MDKLLDRLVTALEEAHNCAHELQHERAMDPRFLTFHRHLWIVRHSLNAARAALLDVSGDASSLRDKGVEL